MIFHEKLDNSLAAIEPLTAGHKVSIQESASYVAKFDRPALSSPGMN